MKSPSRNFWETTFVGTALVAMLAIGGMTWWIDARARTDRQKIELLADIVQNSGTAVAVVKADTREIIHWNMAAERLLGWSWADVYGEDVEMLIPPEYREQHLAGIAKAKEGTVSRITCTALRSDGTELEVEIGVRDATVDGKHYWVATMDDPAKIKTMAFGEPVANGESSGASKQ